MKRKSISIFLPIIAVLLVTTINAAPFYPGGISPIDPGGISPIDPGGMSPIDPGDISPIDPGNTYPINPINASHIEQVMPGLPNPATTYCVNHGGNLKNVETPEGTVGYCDLPDGTTCEEWAFYNGECGSSNNPSSTINQKSKNDKILIQGKVTSIDQYRDFTIYVDKVLQGYGLDGISGFKLVPGVIVETTPVDSSVSVDVGDCVEVFGKWWMTDSPPVYLGDSWTYIKKITCLNSPICTPGPTRNCKCLNGEIWNEYQNEDCTKEWRIAENCNDRGPNWSCENCQCVETTPKCTPGPTGNCKCLNGEIWNEYQNEDCTKEWRIAENCKDRGPKWSCENCQCVETCENGQAFEDTLKSYNEGFWKKSADCGGRDSLSNDCPDLIEFPGSSFMSIRVDKNPCSSIGSECSKKEFFAGGYQTKCKYGYGYLEVYLRPAVTNGVVTGFFIYDGYFDETGESRPRAEIDIEFLGDQKDKMYVNYWRNGIRREPPVASINLGFDASLEWHKYAIDWSKDTIVWLVDDEQVWTESWDEGKNIGLGWAPNGEDKAVKSTTPLPTPTGVVILNLYPNTWAGDLDYKGPIYAHFKDIKYFPG